MQQSHKKLNILYVFSGEKAQGAEIVTDRLMLFNAAEISTHLFIAPGDFARRLINEERPYCITMLKELGRLNRTASNRVLVFLKAVANHFVISYRTCRYIKKEKIAVIHANNITAASYLLPVLFFSKLFLRKTKWIWSDHDMGYRSGIDHFISKMAVRMYDRTIAVSHAVTKKYPFSKNVTVLYNGLDTNVFKSDERIRKEFREKFRLADACVLMGIAGKITPGKGHSDLIDAVNLMRTDHANLYLILAGSFDDNYPAYTEKVKTAIALNSNIIYAGFLNNIVPYYNGCDVIISNSDCTVSESLGTTIYEAMSLQKIVVASNTGGSPEIICDGVDGLLFTPENKSLMLQKITEGIEHHRQGSMMGTEARKTVKKKFSIGVMASGYNEILKELQIHS